MYYMRILGWVFKYHSKHATMHYNENAYYPKWDILHKHITKGIGCGVKNGNGSHLHNNGLEKRYFYSKMHDIMLIYCHSIFPIDTPQTTLENKSTE